MVKVYRIYELVDPRTNVIFYVGKETLLPSGKSDRQYKHLYQSQNNKGINKNKETIIRDILNSGHEPIFNVIDTFTDENMALITEKQIIDKHGLNNLTNIYCGGGSRGSNRKPVSIETAKRISNTKLNNYRLGITKPTKHSEEWKTQLKVNNPSFNFRKPIIQYSENMVQIKIWPGLSLAARTLGLSKSNISAVAKNRQNQKCGGFFWRYSSG